MTNTALVTMVNEDFVCGFKAMLCSLLEHNTWFDLPIVVLDDGLTNKTKRELLERYGQILFKPINRKKYEGTNFEITAPKLRSTYYKLDVFNMTDFKRLVFIDSDVVILRSIENLFKCTANFAAVKAYDAGRDLMRRDINSGVFVVNDVNINKEVYNDLLKIAKSGHKMPDQTTLNIYFRDATQFLDKTFNVEKRMLFTQNFKAILQNMKILHFVGEKPWQKKTKQMEEQYMSLEKVWFNYYHE